MRIEVVYNEASLPYPESIYVCLVCLYCEATKPIKLVLRSDT